VCHGESVTGLTFAEALALPAFRRSDPVVVTGSEHLDRTIRWAHVTEQSDVVPLLRPGDLVLTMGTNLPADDDVHGFDRFAGALAESESSGLIVELGQRWSETVPDALVTACEEHSIPLVVLTHETQFAALTQAIGEKVVDAQLDELLEAQRVHDTFTELSFGQAGPAEILDAVSRLTGGPVVLENAQHRPLDFLTGPETSTSFLDNWQARSARVTIAMRTGWHERNGWLITRLGADDQDWGRLVVAASSQPSQRLVAVVERAAAALALHRLHDRDRDNLTRRTHNELMSGLRRAPDSEELLNRCEIAGFPTHRRQFLGLVARPLLTKRDAKSSDLVASFVRAAHGLKVPVLACEVEREARVLLSVPIGSNADAIVDHLAQRAGPGHDVVVAAGRPASSREEIDRSMVEARQVADAIPVAAASRAEREPLVHRLEDLHLRGLLALFGDDDRLRLYVERELGALRRTEERQGGPKDLLGVLKALLDHPTSKTDAAASLHLSRAAFYDRLAKIEHILRTDLNDPDVRVSLHVALVADEMSRAQG
jgi:PucR family transcriptional regulator, purine catabolism regulatory protein